jgi:hypothetical protein
MAHSHCGKSSLQARPSLRTIMRFDFSSSVGGITFNDDLQSFHSHHQFDGRGQPPYNTQDYTQDNTATQWQQRAS